MRQAMWSFIVVAMVSVPNLAQPKPDVIQQLLDLPAPRPANPQQPKPPTLAGYDEKTLPPNDAPMEVLETYWSAGGPHPGKAKMSAQVRQRFLAYAEQHRDKLSFFLDQEFLPDNPETHARVKAMMEVGLTSYYEQTDKEQVRQHEEIWKNKLREWLLLHSNFFLDDLEQKARGVKDETGEITAERYLQALAKLDWERAKPILDNYAYSPQLRTATLALTLLYQHAIESNGNEATSLRARLQELVANQHAPGKARNLACTTLMQAKWDGRDEWFLTLFADDSLRVMEDSSSGTLYPLNKPVQADPEHWVPLLTKLVGHSNPAMHEAAVDCLASFDPDSPRKEAMQPLLPWLANPNWSAAAGRKELLQSLKKVSLPEAVPGLIWVVENDEDEELQLLATEALATYRDQRAVAALKRLLARVAGPTECATVVNALVACGGLSDDEIARAIEAYATRVAITGKGDLTETIEHLDIDFDDNVPLQIAVGKVLSETETPREAVATRLLDRVKRLEKPQPALARLLLTMVQKWELRVVDADIVERIAANKADVKELEAALKIRERLRKSMGDELQAVAVRRDQVAGIAAVLLADENLLYKILNDEDKEPKRALLAAARLTRTPLPLERVGELLNDATLKLAAERYLASEDSAAARGLILAKHPGEALILGATAEVGATPTLGAAMFAKWEEKLRAELLAQNGADEIIALMSPRALLTTTTVTTATGMLTTMQQTQYSVVIRVRKDKAELAWRTDEAREKIRALQVEEWHELQTFLTEKKIDALPPHISLSGSQQTEYEFLRLTKDGGRRVYIANLTELSGNQDPYSLLLRKFRNLTEGKEFQVRYDLRLKGLEVLLADEKKPVAALCGDGGKLYVRFNSTVLMTGYRQGDLHMIAGASDWYEVNAGKLGAKVEPPQSCGQPLTVSTPLSQQAMTLMYSVLGSSIPNYVIRPQGIMRAPPLSQSELIVAGDFQDLLESPDGKWLLAVKGSGAAPKSLVKIELTTRQETAINFAVTGKLKLFAVIPGLNKFWFEHQLSDSESKMYLLTPTTGFVENVQGDFRPFSRHVQRNLQATGNPDEVWAAASNPKTKATDIGRYNLKAFSFTPITTIPDLGFTSSDLWVDEAANAIYVVYRGHLLRFPLKP